MCITESHLDDTTLDAEIFIENYRIFRSDRFNKEGGGSIVYVHKSISAIKLDSF